MQSSTNYVPMYEKCVRRGVHPSEAYRRIVDFAYRREDRFHVVITWRKRLWAPFAWRNNPWNRPHAAGWV